MQAHEKFIKLSSETDIADVTFDISKLEHHGVIAAIGFENTFIASVTAIRKEVVAAHKAKIELYAKLFEACVKATEETNFAKIQHFFKAYEIGYQDGTPPLKLALRCLTGYLVFNGSKYGLIYQKSKVSAYGNGFLHAYENGHRSAEGYKDFLNEQFKNNLTDLNAKAGNDASEDKYAAIEKPVRDSVVSKITAIAADTYGDLLNSKSETFASTVLNLTLNIDADGAVSVLKAQDITGADYEATVEQVKKDLVLRNLSLAEDVNLVDLLGKKEVIKPSHSKLRVITKNGFGELQAVDKDGNEVSARKFCVGHQCSDFDFTVEDVRSLKLALNVARDQGCELSVVERHGERFVQLKAQEAFSNLIKMYNKDRNGRGRVDELEQCVSSDDANILLLKAAA